MNYHNDDIDSNDAEDIRAGFTEEAGVSTYVSIGRREGRGPLELSEGRWRLFQADVRHALRLNGLEVVSDTTGRGSYGGTFENDSEETAVIVAAGTPLNGGVDLRRMLAALARSYDQEAIALSVAPVEFVGPAGAGIGS